MNKISVEQVLQIHKTMLEKVGGKAGVRDYNMLESALNVPFQTFLGEDLYPSIEQKAARLCYGLIKNHAFYNGNKSIGVLVFLTFLKINDIKVKFSDDELINIGFSIASDEMTCEELVKVIDSHKIKFQNREFG